MIRFATDLNGNRVYIENAKPKHSYLCESCGTILIPRFGAIKTHHFAHKTPAEDYSSDQIRCVTYNESYTSNQMSEWHIAWQELFPVEQREVVVKGEGKWLRADVLREQQREVIEFQHTVINRETFIKRNEFYTSLKYKIIWLFDFDTIKDKVEYVFPDNYSSFDEDFIRDGQKLYYMDGYAYKAMFGDFKPQNNRGVIMCFSQTFRGIPYIKYVECVADGSEWDLPVKLFVRDLKLKAFVSRIGADVSKVKWNKDKKGYVIT